jgi:hypothetical protein
MQRASVPPRSMNADRSIDRRHAALLGLVVLAGTLLRLR